jgi:hypothetical protein
MLCKPTFQRNVVYTICTLRHIAEDGILLNKTLSYGSEYSGSFRCLGFLDILSTHHILKKNLWSLLVCYSCLFFLVSGEYSPFINLSLLRDTVSRTAVNVSRFEISLSTGYRST